MKAELTDYDMWVVEILEMVRELHFRGVQRVRICAGPSPSGHHWHLAITPASNVLASHGAKMVDIGQAIYYSNAQKGDLFGWTDIEDRSTEALADRFVEFWPEICAEATGRDTAYMAWFAELLHHARNGLLPASFENWGNGPLPQGRAWIRAATMFADTSAGLLPRPPGGESQRGRPIILPTNPLHAVNRASESPCWGHA